MCYIKILNCSHCMFDILLLCSPACGQDFYTLRSDGVCKASIHLSISFYRGTNHNLTFYIIPCVDYVFKCLLTWKFKVKTLLDELYFVYILVYCTWSQVINLQVFPLNTQVLIGIVLICMSNGNCLVNSANSC